ncbi:complexin-3-like [Hypomesus transpacificus]|uniref:complexin-3-like n=1 Tax=Hypomesus transpacificus TaxID=137520 RepID=UPI001F087CC7|nr:complexin-3-like [Hypomesus transpacificus]
MSSVVKRSLKVPIKMLSGCVSGVKEGGTWGSRVRRSRFGGGGRGGRRGRGGQGAPSQSGLPWEPPCSYLADMEKERKLREVLNAQKNAERATMRAHFRKKYQLSKNCKDASHRRAVGGKLVLPPQLAKMVHPTTKTKDKGSGLLSAFQGLRFNRGVVTGSKPSKTPTSTPANPESCKVM